MAHAQLSQLLDAWHSERTATNFERMAEQAQRLGKPLEVTSKTCFKFTLPLLAAPVRTAAA